MARAATTKRAEKPAKKAAPAVISDEDGERWLKSIRQVTLLKILHTAAKVVLDRESRGMPRNRDGTYDLLAVTDWLKQRGNGIYEDPPRAVPAADGGGAVNVNEYVAMGEKYKALEARRKHLEGEGLLIRKEVAEREHLTMITQVRAALLAQAEVLAPQLANLGPREVVKVLDKRFRWLCQQFDDGWVPLPDEAKQVIDDLVMRLKPNLAPIDAEGAK